MARRALPVIPPEFHDDALPKGIFSHSQYNQYKNCAKAYEFRYVKRMISAASTAMFRGTVVHEGAEFTHKHMIENDGKVPSLAEALAKVSDKFDADKGEVGRWNDDPEVKDTPGDVAKLQGELKDVSLRAYKVYHDQAVPKIHPVAAEKHFIKRIGSVPVQGYIDLIDHVHGPAQDGIPDPGHLVVADLKTGATWSQSDIDKDTQLTLYHIVEGIPDVRVDNLKLLKGGPALLQLHSSRDGMARRNLIEDMEDTVDHIKKGDFPMTSIDHWSCTKKWCSFFDKCRGRSL